jgi:hypothetical protein
MLTTAYLPLFYWCRESELGFIKKYGAIIVTLLAAACASMRFFVPNWGRSEEPAQIVRVLSALGFWILTGTVLALSLYTVFKDFKERRALDAVHNNT